MNVYNPRFTLNRKGLRYVIAICAGIATLASGSSTVVAQELEEVTVTESHISRDTNTTSVQPIAAIGGEMLSTIRSTDIAAILNDNPALLSSVSSTNCIDNDAANVDNTDNVVGSTLDLRGL